MPCFSQMIAAPIPGKINNGKQQYKFLGKAAHYTRWSKLNLDDVKILPCKQCIGCRLERSRQWAVRLMHEIPFHKGACFLTLTYDEKSLPFFWKDDTPVRSTLMKTHLQEFWKKLRARNEYHGKAKIKYFACGEYGEEKGRPHYHAALYGSVGLCGRKPKRTETRPSRSGGRQFTHSDIAACWPHGDHTISELTFESAAYIARYILKKVTGDLAQDHYGDLQPEFQTSSNGLGRSHVEAWLSDVYPSDHVVLPGRGAFTPPPYYDRILEKVDPSLFEAVKKARDEAREKMTMEELFLHFEERHREGRVRKLVTEKTLIRSML